MIVFPIVGYLVFTVSRCCHHNHLLLSAAGQIDSFWNRFSYCLKYAYMYVCMYLVCQNSSYRRRLTIFWWERSRHSCIWLSWRTQRAKRLVWRMEGSSCCKLWQSAACARGELYWALYWALGFNHHRLHWHDNYGFGSHRIQAYGASRLFGFWSRSRRQHLRDWRWRNNDQGELNLLYILMLSYSH